MNFICDVHIPYKLVNYFLKIGYRAVHINSVLEDSITKDSAIAYYADGNDQLVVTKDEDFENLHFATGSPKKLIRILLGNIATTELIRVFAKHVKEIEKLTVHDRFYVEIGRDQFTYTTDYTV